MASIERTAYPRFSDSVTANELHVPASEPGEKGVKRPVYLRLESADVCHSFWVPRLAGKMDLIPGRTNSLWFQTDKPGLYLGQCAEYCGTQHANMLIRVIVQSPEDFERWLENQKKPAVDDPAARAGKAVFLSLSCVKLVLMGWLRPGAKRAYSCAIESDVGEGRGQHAG